MELTNKTAVVTGGSKGIGLETARTLLKYGAQVIIVSSGQKNLDEAMQDLKVQYAGQVSAYTCDVSSYEQCVKLSLYLESSWKSLDILVNCAGINIRKKVEEISIEEYRRIMAINLDGTFYMCKALLPLLKKSLGARIINTSSLMAEITRPNVAAYAASKAGITQLTKALAVEWAEYGIGVNAVIPGFTLTKMAQDLQKDEAFNNYVLSRTPLKRWGKTQDVAELIAFLASPLSSFITGTAVPVEGGILASLGFSNPGARV